MPRAGGSFSWMQQRGGSRRAFWGSRGSRGGKSSGCLSVLAGGAEKRCSSPKFLVSYRCGADGAGQLSSAIHLKMDLEIAAVSACINEIADCRTTAFDGGGEDLSDFVDQQNVAFFTYCARFSSSVVRSVSLVMSRNVMTPPMSSRVPSKSPWPLMLR